MKLLYDLSITQPNASGASHGGGKYAIVVFLELLRRGVPMECVYDSTLPLRPDVRTAVVDNDLPLHDLNQKSPDQICSEGKIDTFYRAAPSAQGLPSCTKRNIITLHGLREYEIPADPWSLKYDKKLYSRLRNFVVFAFNGWWKRKSLKHLRSTLLRPDLEFVVVSQHTKYSCLCCMPELRPENIRVFYSPSTSTERTDVKPYTKDYKYVLLVSANRQEKNNLRAIAALDELFSERPELKEYKVLITGSDGSGLRYKIRNEDNFRFLGYVSEAALESLYCGAHLFVYPSINEGFGYPPLEAMRYGVPVAASPVSSIDEVCGDAALYFNPFDKHEIKGRILRMLTDDDCRSLYSKRGLERFALITAKQKQDLAALVDFITGSKK